MTGPDQRSAALAVRPKARRRAIRLGPVERGRLRRRVRFLRKQRELQIRDLGGLVFDMYRFGSKRQDLVREKLRLMFEADRELRAFEATLGGRRRPEVREPGVGGSCPRCLTLYSTDAHYCWRCGLALTEAAEAGAVVDVDLDEPQGTVEADAIAPEQPADTAAPEPAVAASSSNGTRDEELTKEIAAGRVSSSSAHASRS